MLFDKEGRILIKNLYLLKEYNVQELLKDFPSKSWNELRLRRLLKS